MSSSVTFHPYLLRQCLSLNLELTVEAILTDQWTPRISLPLPHNTDFRHVHLDLTLVLGSKLEYSGLSSKHYPLSHLLGPYRLFSCHYSLTRTANYYFHRICIVSSNLNDLGMIGSLQERFLKFAGQSAWPDRLQPFLRMTPRDII